MHSELPKYLCMYSSLSHFVVRWYYLMQITLQIDSLSIRFSNSQDPQWSQTSYWFPRSNWTIVTGHPRSDWRRREIFALIDKDRVCVCDKGFTFKEGTWNKACAPSIKKGKVLGEARDLLSDIQNVRRQNKSHGGWQVVFWLSWNVCISVFVFGNTTLSWAEWQQSMEKKTKEPSRHPCSS